MESPGKARRRKRAASNASDETSISTVPPTVAELRAQHFKFHTSRDGSGIVHFIEQASPLSSDNKVAFPFTGFRNLAILVLVLSNIRLVIENVTKYGLLVNVSQLFVAVVEQDLSRWPNVSIYAMLPIFLFAAYAIERAAGNLWLHSAVANVAHACNVIAALALPSYWVWTSDGNEVAAILLMLTVVTEWMKITSYARVNAFYRSEFRLRNGVRAPVPSGQIAYPDNVSMGNMLYFVCAPTLCYQLNYPRSAAPIRWGWLMRRMGELLFFSALILVLAQQYMVPTVQNTMTPMMALDLPRLVERLLKMGTPNFLIWILGFYVIFELYLNVWSEILHFGDRLFYRDWWNSTTLSRFWSTWNLPVHNWLVQTLYLPLRSAGLSRQGGYVVCFLVSGFLHELVLDAAFRRFGYFAFSGMVGQLPMCALTDLIRGRSVGNVIMWLSLLLGQPLAVILYYQDWYIHSKLHI